MSRYTQRYDNEGWTEKSGKPFKIACCDCGLIHQMVIVANRKGELGIAAKQDRRATAARRRKKDLSWLLDRKIPKGKLPENPVLVARGTTSSCAEND